MSKVIFITLLLVISNRVNAQQMVWTNSDASANLGMVTTYNFAIYDDGTLYYQDPKLARVESPLPNNTFKSLNEFAKMLDDVSLRKNIVNEQYTLTPVLGAVQVKIKDVPHIYTYTPYLVRLLKKEIAKHLIMQ
jgi:uncharacterized membrane protein